MNTFWTTWWLSKRSMDDNSRINLSIFALSIHSFPFSAGHVLSPNVRNRQNKTSGNQPAHTDDKINEKRNNKYFLFSSALFVTWIY